MIGANTGGQASSGTEWNGGYAVDAMAGTASNLERYHRQALLREIGEEGQRRIAAGHALIVGCGALGTVAAELLARAGVGTLTLVDRDIVETTNLQRQVLFDERDANEGVPKAEAARRRLREINSGIEVRAVVEDFSCRNTERVLAEADGAAAVGAIVDGTDNFETRYLINDLAVRHGRAWVYGAAVGMTGMSMTVVPGTTACLRCAFEEPPGVGSAAGATCDTVGVFSPVTAVVASVQAGEALKVLAGRADAAGRGLLTIDGWGGEHRRVELAGAKRDDCPCCGLRRFPFLIGERGGASAALCGRGSVQVSPETPGKVDLPALAARLSAHGSFEATRFLVRGTLKHEGVRLTVFGDGRAIIGVDRAEAARTLYARYVGG